MMVEACCPLVLESDDSSACEAPIQAFQESSGRRGLR